MNGASIQSCRICIHLLFSKSITNLKLLLLAYSYSTGGWMEIIIMTKFAVKQVLLRPPHTSRFFVGRQKILTCRLVCGEFRQVCDKIGACRAKSALDIKTSCRALSASVRWTKTICRRSRAPQPIRKCHESHLSGIGAILILNDLAPSLNAVSPIVATKNWLVCGKLMARQILTRFDPDKKICSSTTKNRLVCGSLKFVF